VTYGVSGRASGVRCALLGASARSTCVCACPNSRPRGSAGPRPGRVSARLAEHRELASACAGASPRLAVYGNQEPGDRPPPCFCDARKDQRAPGSPGAARASGIRITGGWVGGQRTDAPTGCGHLAITRSIARSAATPARRSMLERRNWRAARSAARNGPLSSRPGPRASGRGVVRSSR